jgi:ankyrin repeat protein
MKACDKNGTLDKVKAILNKKGSGSALINRQTQNGSTPLSTAYYNKKQDIVEYLLEHGADIDKQDGIGFTVLITACFTDDYDGANYFIEHGANVNIQDVDGYTALMLACQKGDIQIVRLLINSGADIDIKDGQGDNALDHAIRWNSNNPKFIKNVETAFNQQKATQTLSILRDEYNVYDADVSEYMSDFLGARETKRNRKGKGKNKKRTKMTKKAKGK